MIRQKYLWFVFHTDAGKIAKVRIEIFDEPERNFYRVHIMFRVPQDKFWLEIESRRDRGENSFDVVEQVELCYGGSGMLLKGEEAVNEALDFVENYIKHSYLLKEIDLATFEEE